MNKERIQERGIILFIVLATIFVVILLGNVVLGIISSQSRLTRHKVSRIQSYYAALAGVNFAFDKLRTGDWPIPAPNQTDNHCLARDTVADCDGVARDITDNNIPISITWVRINVSGNAQSGCVPPSGIPACISATANYAYTP